MVNMNKKEPSIIKTWLALAACAIVFCTMVMSLAGCSNSEDKNQCMEDQCLILVTHPYSVYNDETVSFTLEKQEIYINTHYIMKITPTIYYSSTHIAGYKPDVSYRGIDKDNPLNGATIYLNDGSFILVMETPEEVLKLATGVS